MAEVVLDHVSKLFPGGVTAVDDLSLTIADREFLVLVGPSGCGKSTTLRMIAGLEEISSGTIRIGARVVNDVQPKDRNIAMVFQNYALYPHMTVYKNMAFSLMLRRKYGLWDNPLFMLVAPGKYRRARAERTEIDQRVHSAAAMLGIDNLLSRRPAALSGGQRQRVAVGRAIVREPQAFLFDEPLSNLDARLRIEMRAELKRLHRRVQTTTIYVTHDQEEAMTLGDRVAVLKDGLLHQCGSPFEIYERPVNRFVAGFVGTPPMNFLTGRLVPEGERLLFEPGAAGDSSGASAGVAAGSAAGAAADSRLALCPAHRQRLEAHVGQPVTIGIRPELLSPADGPPDSRLRVRVDVVEPLGDRMDVQVSTSRGDRLTCRIDARAPLREGQAVDLHVDMQRVHVFEASGAERNLTL